MKHLLLLGMALAAALLPATYSSALETCDSQACTAQAQNYLEQLDALAFDQVWQAFTPLYQTLHDPYAWQKRQRVLREAYGPLIKRTLFKATCRDDLYHAPDGMYCLVQFRTSFFNKQDAVETVILDAGTPGFMPIAEFRTN